MIMHMQVRNYVIRTCQHTNHIFHPFPLYLLLLLSRACFRLLDFLNYTRQTLAPWPRAVLILQMASLSRHTLPNFVRLCASVCVKTCAAVHAERGQQADFLAARRATTRGGLVLGRRRRRSRPRRRRLHRAVQPVRQALAQPAAAAAADPREPAAAAVHGRALPHRRGGGSHGLRQDDAAATVPARGGLDGVGLPGGVHAAAARCGDVGRGARGGGDGRAARRGRGRPRGALRRVLRRRDAHQVHDRRHADPRGRWPTRCSRATRS